MSEVPNPDNQWRENDITIADLSDEPVLSDDGRREIMERQGDDVSKKQPSIPVKWVSGSDPKECAACSKAFRANDMIHRVGIIAIHATEACVERFQDDCDLIWVKPRKGKVT